MRVKSPNLVIRDKMAILQGILTDAQNYSEIRRICVCYVQAQLFEVAKEPVVFLGGLHLPLAEDTHV
jgi:hypothetical protein